MRKPLNPPMLEEMALAYVARFATTAHGLERYCRRKLRERGWEGQEAGEPAPDVAALVSRFVANRYVDDGEYAQARIGSLLRRGYGARRVGQALDAAGVAKEDRRSIAESEARKAALRLVEKRRFGPFGADAAPPADRAVREKQLAAMLRAGHSPGNARRVIEAPDRDAAIEWAHEFDQKEGD